MTEEVKFNKKCPNCGREDMSEKNKYCCTACYNMSESSIKKTIQEIKEDYDLR